jgi:hypothetical protein
MNNTTTAPVISQAERFSVDGTFISILRFGEVEGTPHTKMCVLAKPSRSISAQLLFLDASSVEAQIKKLGIGNRHKVQLVFLRSPAGNKAVDISKK